MRKHIALFADVGNLFFHIGKKYPGRKLDYDAYLTAATGDNIVLRAFAYGTQQSTEAVPFIDCLRRIGFEVKYRTLKEVYTQNRKELRRIDWGIGIAVDVVRNINRVNKVVLGTNDLAMIPLIEWLREQGCEVQVFACGIAKELRAAASAYTEIEECLLARNGCEAPAAS